MTDRRPGAFLRAAGREPALPAAELARHAELRPVPEGGGQASHGAVRRGVLLFTARFAIESS